MPAKAKATPANSKYKMTGVKLPPDVYNALLRAAEDDNRSISNYIGTLLRAHLADLIAAQRQEETPTP